jgi:NAD(P)-dependent dehydrogenase (short-subunit alcohol dehydrogenase family)
MRLAGRVALVTGGARRVGRVLARTLAERGCDVALTYLTSAREAREMAAEIRGIGRRALAIRVDQRRPAEVRRAVAEVVSRLGRLDILINSASSFRAAPLEKITPAQWEEALAANLSGPWWFARESALRMKAQGQGRIINILDISVLSPWTECLPYSAAKGGLWTLTLGLAKALAPRVQVNGIAPGPILPPLSLSGAAKRRALKKTLLKRWGSPQDIAAAMLYLLEGGDFVTGAILPVDGGRRLAE